MVEGEKSRLTLYICAAIVAAIVAAVAFPHLSIKLHAGGEIFLRLLKMMVVPLVMASVMSGIIGLGDVRKLGRPGGYTILYYVSTTVLAVITGLVIVNVIQPGVGAFDEEALQAFAQSGRIAAVEAESATIGTILNNLLLMLFTDNLIFAASETNLLPLIVFSIIFAGMLTTMGERVNNNHRDDRASERCPPVLRTAPDEARAHWNFLPRGCSFWRSSGRRRVRRGAAADRVVRHHSSHGTRNPRAGDGPPALLGIYTQKSVSILGSHVAGATHGVLDCEFVGDTTGYHEISGRIRRSLEAVRRVRVAAGRHDQYGWHGSLRGGGGDLHRAGHRSEPGYRAAGNHRSHRPR